jgi:uncharacterized protein YbcC (UPF0753/DUF2309 family)
MSMDPDTERRLAEHRAACERARMRILDERELDERERKRLDEIEHAQDRDYWRTERERLDALDAEDGEAQP